MKKQNINQNYIILSILISILFLTNHTMAQSFNYNEAWKKVESYKNKGQFKSLKTDIQTIYNHAKADNNTSQKIKSILYLSQIDWQTSDDDVSENKDNAYNTFHFFEKEIKSANEIEKAILQNYLAQMYQQYASSIYFKLGNTQQLHSKKQDDFKTWTYADFRETSDSLFKKSISNKNELIAQTASKYEVVLQNNTKYNFQTTLYDILANNYYSYLTNTWRTNDEENKVNKLRSSEILNSLIASHKNDKDKSLLLYYLVLQLKNDKNYENGIQNIINQYPNEPYTARLYANLAKNQMGNNERVKAHQTCETGLKKTVKSDYQNDLYNVLHEIESINVSLSINNKIYPNQNIPLNISHQNLSEVSLNIYNVTPTEQDLLVGNCNLASNIIYTKNEKLVKTIPITLKSFDDYATHSTIYKIDGLPKGTYKLAIKNKDQAIDYSIILVGESIVADAPFINKNTHQLFNSYTGELEKNKSIALFKRSESNNDKKIKYSLQNKLTTDPNGFFNTPENNNDYVISYNNQLIAVSPSYSYYNHNNDNNPITYDISIFTDRAIYRPGQKVYFKGIAIKNDTITPNVMAKENFTVRLLDVNSKEVQTLHLTTNDYGSIFGEFILPNNGLTGNYTITFDNNVTTQSKYFRVEEYKRPKFEVSFDTLKSAYTLQQEVNISGKAQSYAGAAISDAKVTYSVTRRETYVWKRFGDYFPFNNSIETVASGDTTTDSNGKFIIPFIAKADSANDLNNKRSYQYTVNVSVTDVNGETHSQNQYINIGDLPYYLNLQLPADAPAKDFKEIQIQARNLNGINYPAKGNITITKLNTPSRIITPNSQTNTTYQLYDYNQFVSYFPHLSYGKEDENPENYKKGNIIFQKNFDTENDSVILDKQLERGYYLVEAKSIYSKDTITDYAIVQLTDDNNKSSDQAYFLVKTDKTNYKVGDIVNIDILSDIKEPTFVQILVGENDTTNYKTYELKDGKVTITHKITTNDILHGLFYKAAMIKWNDYAISEDMISIIANNQPPLKIEAKTFRDKIEPGKPEKWTLHISGQNKDKVTSEILASMYDASLDQFATNSFNFRNSISYPLYNNNYFYTGFYNDLNQLNTNSSINQTEAKSYLEENKIAIQNLNWFGFRASEYGRNRLLRSVSGRAAGVNLQSFDQSVFRQNAPMSKESELNDVVVGYGSKKKIEVTGAVAAVYNDKAILNNNKTDNEIIPRTNLQETTFFYPNLLTDKNGDVQLEFTSPEALTKWKLLLFAHNKEVQTGQNTFYTQTQKDLMVVPNLPRFLREKDKIVISTKINNLSSNNLSGKAQLVIADAFTGEILDKYFNNESNEQAFTTNAQQNTMVNWTITIPENHSAVTFKIVAKAGEYSDGEENMLPILTNRTLVTETQPLSIREGQNKEWTIPNFSIPDTNATKSNFSLSVEMFTNPIWSAVFSLPYLREYPYDCSEQVFSRYFSSVLSNYIVAKNPTIKQVFDEWNSKGLMKSNLEKNQEIKSIILEESPWILDGQNETEQMRRISLLFDINKMSNDIQSAFEKLKSRQKPSGGFAWYGDGNEDEYITEYLIQGFGKLKKLLGEDYKKYASEDFTTILQNAVQYVDNYQENEIKKEQKLIKQYPIQFMNYYYIRSFWLKEFPLNKVANNYLSTILKSLSKEGLEFDLKRKALAALVLERYNQHSQAQKLIRNLKETSVESDEQGMYWKNNLAGWYWYQSPIENQTTNMEAFSEITPNDTASVEAMKVWLMKNKQTNSWSTTKATTEAIYALLHFGKSWMNSENGLTIKLGDQEIYPTKNQDNNNATGYYKQTWAHDKITSDMRTIKVSKTGPGLAYGGVYYQYLEDLNKIKSNGYDIKMEKKLFLKKNTDKGIQLFEITHTTPIKVGDLVTVRVIVRTDRDMQYIHLKDMRAAGFEPVNVLSNYKWQNGAGYYESTKDAATNFFFGYLPKGTYTFDYDVRANNAGVFSNGITTIQNMYAPEMSAHSEGMNVIIQ